MLVSSVAGKGDWVVVFSTLDQLRAFAGDSAWMSLTGTDLWGLLPVGIGVAVDPLDQHGMALPPGFGTGGTSDPDGGTAGERRLQG